MNVGYEDYNAADVAQLLGVQKCTVSWWCRNGYIKYHDVSSPGSSNPRYLFTEDEVDRVSKLIDKYGKKRWLLYNHSDDEKKPEPATTQTVEEENIIDTSIDTVDMDDTEDIAKYIARIRDLKRQRDKLLKELDNIDNAIKTMKQKVIESI